MKRVDRNIFGIPTNDVPTDETRHTRRDAVGSGIENAHGRPTDECHARRVGRPSKKRAQITV